MRNQVKTFIALLALGVMILPQGLMAQVASPSLDPTRAVIAPGAVAWKTQGAIFGGVNEGTGKRQKDGSEQFDFSTSVADAGITVPAYNAVFEASARSQSHKINLSSAYDGHLPARRSDSRINIAMGDQEMSALGLGYKQSDIAEYEDGTMPKIKRSVSKISGGVSLRFGESFYLGLGGNRARQSSDNRVDLSWNEKYVGLGLKFGSPEGHQFRIEASSLDSNEAREAAADVMLEAWHPSEKKNITEVEWAMGGLLFSYHGEKNTIGADYVDAEGLAVTEIISYSDQAGVLWIPKEGMLLGFYFRNDKLEADYEETVSNFQIRTGFLF